MNNGWVKLSRKMLDWEWLSDSRATQFFVYCLLKANHTKNKWRGHSVESGQFITSLGHISNDLGLSVQQVRTCIKKLKSTGEITSKTTNKFTLISITNWELYQTRNKQNNNEITNEQQTNNNQSTTNKNEKNDNNEKNIDISQSKIAHHVPYQKIVDLYHQILPELPECKKLTTKRKGQIRQRHINDIEDIETWQEYFEYIKGSNFLMGRVPPNGDRRPFIANLEWLTNESNYCKIYEGKYHG